MGPGVRRDDVETHVSIFTYSKSPGLLSIPTLGRRNPGGEFADAGDRNHQGSDEIAVIDGRKPFALSLVPGRIVDQHAVRRGVNILELADLAMERRRSAASA